MTKKEALFSPFGICVMYVFAAALAIIGFRFVFPYDLPPLQLFSFSWRLNGGIYTFIALFPALALSALVIPFGFSMHLKKPAIPFSQKFLQTLKPSIITAILSSVIYGLLFFVALPIVRNNEADMRFQGQLFFLAREQAEMHIAQGEWAQAASFLSISESIWPGGHQIAVLHDEINIRLEIAQLAALPAFAPEPPLLPGQGPLTVTEALALAQTAFNEERFFDAHWLATIGERLANPGSPEVFMARRIASTSWEGVNTLAPSAQELHSFEIFSRIRSAYQAMASEEWIRAYYLFLDLLQIVPENLDVQRFFSMSEEGLAQVAFFTDQMDMALGTILTGAVFSFPFETGRAVIRLSSISMLAYSAYTKGVEMLAFDSGGQLLWRMEAPYARISPLYGLPSGPMLSVLMRAVDRHDENLLWEPVVESFAQAAPDSAQIALPISWNDFVLLADVRRGMPVLPMWDLMRAATNLGSYGYKPAVFQVELLSRLSEPVMLLLLGIVAIILGWRFRAFQHPRFAGFLMLFVLPLVFYGVVSLCRTLIYQLGILTVVSLGFASAAVIFGVAAVLFLIGSLIALAYQH